MSRVSHPREETWSQLQERVRRNRELRASPSTGLAGDIGREQRRSVPPNPLPRLESPNDQGPLRITSPELRGSHYPRVPPLSSQRLSSDDTLSLDSFNSDTEPVQAAPPSQSATAPPLLANGTSQPSDSAARSRVVPVWDQYTGRKTGYEPREQRRRGKRKYYVRQPSVDIEGDIRDAMQANEMEVLARQRDRYRDQVYDGEGASLREYDNVFGGKEVIREPAPRRREPSAHDYMQDELFSRTFLEYFITGCLQDDMILDVAIDVMTEAREERSMEHELSRPVLEAGEEILQEVVQETLRELAHLEIRTTVIGFWSTAQESPSIYRPVAKELIREVIDEEIAAAVPECISELVSEYFVQKDVVADFDAISEEVIGELLPDIVVEAVYDESIVSIVELLIQDEIVSFASSFMEETFAPGRPKIPASPEDRLKDKDEMVHLADDFLLDAVIFDNLLSTRLLPNQQVWSPEEYLDLFLDSLLLDQVLGQQLEVVRRRDATEECLPLKRFHEKICTNVAIDVVLGELMGHLDQDMADLDEYELMMDRPNGRA